MQLLLKSQRLHLCLWLPWPNRLNHIFSLELVFQPWAKTRLFQQSVCLWSSPWLQNAMETGLNLISNGNKMKKKMLLCPKLIQFNSVAQSCPTLCDPMNRSTPGLPVYHQLPTSTQTHVYRVGDAIQPSHPLLSPSPPALNLSQHQGLFQ